MTTEEKLKHLITEFTSNDQEPYRSLMRELFLKVATSGLSKEEQFHLLDKLGIAVALLV